MLTENRENDSLKSRGTYRFYGLDRTRRPDRGAMEAMTNMTAAEFPCAAPAPSRSALVTTASDIQAVAAPDALISESVDGLTGVMGGAFYYNGVRKSGRYVLTPAFSWTIARLGKVYIINGTGAGGKAAYTYNADADEFRTLTKTMDRLIVTAGTDNRGSFIETYRYIHTEVYNHRVTLDDGSVMDGDDFYTQYNSCRTESNIFMPYFRVGDEVELSGFPKSGPGGRLWYYTGGPGDSGEVAEVTNYDVSVNNTADKTAERMSRIDRDAVALATVSGFDVTLAGGFYAHRIYFELADKTGAANEFKNMLGRGTNNANYYAQGVTLRLAYPAFSDIAVHDNRLWGATVNGEHIYGSASDDISDFSGASINEGLAARLTPYLPGASRGICSYGGDLLVFKESAVILVWGSAAAGYRYEIIHGIGCIDPRSIAVTPAGVIFLSRNGFCIYDGSAPRSVSQKLNTVYTEAVSGFDGDTYFASALRPDGARELLAYDMRYGTWHIRDDLEAVGMFRFKDAFCFADRRSIYTESGEPSEWSFTLARTTDNSLDNKTLTELWIYAELTAGAEFTVYTEAADRGWRQHETFTDTGLKLYRCPVRALAGTDYRIRIDGRGMVVFYEIEVKESDHKGRRYKER